MRGHPSRRERLRATRFRRTEVAARLPTTEMQNALRAAAPSPRSLRSAFSDRRCVPPVHAARARPVSKTSGLVVTGADSRAEPQSPRLPGCLGGRWSPVAPRRRKFFCGFMNVLRLTLTTTPTDPGVGKVGAAMQAPQTLNNGLPDRMWPRAHGRSISGCTDYCSRRQRWCSCTHGQKCPAWGSTSSEWRIEGRTTLFQSRHNNLWCAAGTPNGLRWRIRLFRFRWRSNRQYDGGGTAARERAASLQNHGVTPNHPMSEDYDGTSD